ncbi:MAG TPA: alpha/beta family hydrolase [Thermoanaerobaculia bacterium]|nr:alpha/beta family hydrolase [Thermoanaerobaculia bacterium]
MNLLFDGPQDAAWTLALAHGAGAPMDSPHLSGVARGLAREGIRVARFEFPYMEARRHTGRRGTPDPERALRQRWRDVIDELRGAARLAIGGKSLGGRIASLVADEAGVQALVCLGYPFHPPGRPEKLRTQHLAALRTPALILQGTRDAFGLPEEIREYALSPSISVQWIPDGDHSFKPRAASGRTEAQNLEEAVRAAAAFLGNLGVAPARS